MRLQQGPGLLKTFILVIAISAVLTLIGGYALYYALDLDSIEMSIHGFLAMGIGIGLSILLGGGLMALVFYSNSKGHDDTSFHGEKRD